LHPIREGAMPTDGVHSPISNKQKHGVARMEDTERPTRLGSGAWGRRQGLAGLRDDAPSRQLTERTASRRA